MQSGDFAVGEVEAGGQGANDEFMEGIGQFGIVFLDLGQGLQGQAVNDGRLIGRTEAPRGVAR